MSLHFAKCGSDLVLICMLSAGRKWGFYPVAVIQILLCLGTVIGCTILGGESMKVIEYFPDASAVQKIVQMAHVVPVLNPDCVQLVWNLLAAADLQHLPCRGVHATLRFHYRLRHSDDGAVAVTVLPFLALHQLGVLAVQPGLQSLCRRRMYLYR